MNESPPDSPVPNEDTVLTANALKAMAHPLRWRILCTLGDNELSVGEIVERIGTSQSNISQHLEQLRNKNIVTSRKEANRIYYRIRNDQLLTLIGTMRQVLCHANLDDRPLPRDLE
jgi:DNA-binding transcriptional ArsR family regulator